MFERTLGLVSISILALAPDGDAQRAQQPGPSETIRSAEVRPAPKVVVFRSSDRFTGGQERIDFESLSAGASVAPLATTRGVVFETAGGTTPTTWKDPLSRASSGRARVAPTLGGNARRTPLALLVEQPDPDVWPSPMAPLGTVGAVSPLPAEAALWIRFDRELSRVGFEARSLDPHDANLVLTVHRGGEAIDTVYVKLAGAFELVGVESSVPFDALRIDLVNPQSGRLSLDALRYEPDFDDRDADGVADFLDVCPTLWNPGQADADGDGIGDECDAFPLDPDDDEDGDGLAAAKDNCPETYNPDQRDSDADGIGDACDALPLAWDSDGDGVPNGLDNCAYTANPGQEDCDGDGVGDVCDGTLLNPPLIRVALSPGESTVVPITQCLTSAPTILDVVLMIDTTGSMTSEIANVRTGLKEAIRGLRSLLGPEYDLDFALVSFRDYDGSYSNCGYSGSYGGLGDLPYSVDALFADEESLLQAAIDGLYAQGGLDPPESYARCLWEVTQPDSGIDFRPGSAHYVLLWGDEMPHDCDPGEGISCHVGASPGIPSTGIDPGRDAATGTSDDVDFHDDALAGLVADGVRLVTVFSGGSLYQYCAWSEWSQQTNGKSHRITTNARIPDDISIARSLLPLFQSRNAWRLIQPAAVDGSGLAVRFDPPNVVGPVTLEQLGGQVGFAMSLTVPANAQPGTSYEETVQVTADGAWIGSTTVRVDVR